MVLQMNRPPKKRYAAPPELCFTIPNSFIKILPLRGWLHLVVDPHKKGGLKGRYLYSKELRIAQEPRRGGINLFSDYSLNK
jgi:hypothetical protein